MVKAMCGDPKRLREDRPTYRIDPNALLEAAFKPSEPNRQRLPFEPEDSEDSGGE